MRLFVSLLLLLGLAAAAVALPVSDEFPTLPVAADNPPAVSVCPVEEGRGRTTSVDLVSSGPEAGLITGFSAGEESGSRSFDLSADGADSVDGVGLSVVGVAAALVESSTVKTGVATRTTGPASLSVESCASQPQPLVVLAGGSTLSGEEFEIQLMNPYAGAARVSITAVSEAGVESNQALDDVIVHPRTSAVIDLANVLPGREQLSLVIETVSGSVLSIGRFFNGSDSAVWNATAPAEDGFVILPPGGGDRRLILASSTPADLSYQVDLYGPDGLVEAYAVGDIEGQRLTNIDLTGVGRDAVAVRIFATAPVAGFIRHQRGEGVAITSGSSVAAETWQMPGAGAERGFSTSLVILNPSTEDAIVAVDSHLGLAPSQLTVLADSVGVYQLTIVGREAVTVEADRPVVAIWVSRLESGYAATLGVPNLDE